MHCLQHGWAGTPRAAKERFSGTATTRSAAMRRAFSAIPAAAFAFFF